MVSGGGTPPYMPPEAIRNQWGNEDLFNDADVGSGGGGGGGGAAGIYDSELDFFSFYVCLNILRTVRYMFSKGGGGVERSMAADVYAFGIILWELITCEELYPNARGLGFFVEKVAKQGLRPPLPSRQICDEQTEALMIACWAAKITDRPRFVEIVPRLREILRNAFPVQVEERESSISSHQLAARCAPPRV